MWQRNYVMLPTGERVRFALLKRNGTYYARFRDKNGERAKASTGAGKKPAAIEEAQRLILEAYGEAAPVPTSVSWEEAKAKLRQAMTADGKRPRTIKSYLETLDRLADVYPDRGPGDITPHLAEEFKTAYATGRFTKKRNLRKGEEAPTFRRRTQTLDSRLRMLKASFGWFLRLRLVTANPFEQVTLPELDRPEVKYVRRADINQFFTWLEARYPGWTMPKLFFSVKAATGCRLEDVCSLRSHQLQEGRLKFDADQTKNRSERYAVLPADLYASLDAYKGPVYLWERYPSELIAANKAKGYPTHRQNPVFAPERLYLWVLQIMGYYQKATGQDFSSHDFRRAAFTRAAEKDIHVKRAAVAFDVTPETMLKYYTATEKKKTADEVLSDLAGDLLPE